MKKLLLLLFIPLLSYAQKDTATVLRYDFLNKEMKEIPLRNRFRLTKSERRKIFNYREYYIKNGNVVKEVRNYYAFGKDPVFDDQGNYSNLKENKLVAFFTPGTRKGKLRSTYKACLESNNPNCINGDLKKYFPNSQLEFLIKYKNNKPIDQIFIGYYPNGSKKYQGTYKNGKLNGDFLVYDTSGNIISKLIYINDKQIEKILYSIKGKEIDVYNFSKEVTLERAKNYYDNKKRLNNLEGIYKVNGSLVYNKGSHLQWSPDWELALLLGVDGETIYGYQTSCGCLKESKIKNGELRLKLEPTSVENFLYLTWINDYNIDHKELIEVKANGRLILFKNHTMIKSYPLNNKIKIKNPKNSNWFSNGSGVIISKSGYIITNHHVIKDASIIEVEFVQDGAVKKFNAQLIQSDQINDLAILKILDIKFDGVSDLPYNFKIKSSDVGTKVYAFGYPKALTLMGKEVKVTDGIISSKTGMNGDITKYQISAPILPGNSGGPLFDDKGNLIGINSSGLARMGAETTGYTIKSSYVENLIDVLPNKINLPTNNKLKNLTLTEQIKEISKYVVLIKVK